MRSLAGSGATRTLAVDEIVQQPLGDLAFARLDTAQGLLGAPDSGTALLLGFRGGHPNTERGRRGVAAGGGEPGADERPAGLRGELSQLFLVFVGIMLAFGVALGFTITFNTITINVLERERELATMRTFGMSVGRLGTMISVENLLMGRWGRCWGCRSATRWRRTSRRCTRTISSTCRW